MLRYASMSVKNRYAAKLLGPAARVVAVDVNPRACEFAARTAAENGVQVDVVLSAEITASDARRGITLRSCGRTSRRA